MKIIKWILVIIVSILIIYFGVYFYQNINLKKTFEEYNKEKLNKDEALVRCNWNIFKPETAYIFFAMGKGNISFDSVNKIFWSKDDWKNSYIGGTTIKNTTFPQLLKMVKEDCYQFQESGSIGIEETSIQWVYSKAESKEKIKKRKEREEERIKKEKEEWNKLSQEEKDKIIEENKKVEELENLSSEERLKMLKEKYGNF